MDRFGIRTSGHGSRGLSQPGPPDRLLRPRGARDRRGVRLRRAGRPQGLTGDRSGPRHVAPLRIPDRSTLPLTAPRADRAPCPQRGRRRRSHCPADGSEERVRLQPGDRRSSLLRQVSGCLLRDGEKQLDAPPKLDKNGNGVPDYVEAVAKTADGALAYYRSPRICFPERAACESTTLRAFKRPRPDRGGLNALPDIYLKAGLAGDGTTISSSDGVGGAFIVLSPHLSLKSIRPREGLTITLAHELFHLVQDAYVARELPLWIAEGTANAAAVEYATAAAVAGRLRSEDIEDLAVTDQFDLWNQKPWLPLYSGFLDCSRCYGNLLWWVRIFVSHDNLVEHFFERLSTTPAKKLGVGVSALDATFRKYGAFSERSLADAFSAFSIERFLQSRVGTLTPLQLAARGVETVVSPSSTSRGNGVPPPGRLNGFSTHFIPLLVPPEAAGLEVVVETPTESDPLVDLFAGSGTFLQGRRLDRRAAPADAAAGDFMGQPGLHQTLRFDFRDASEKHEVILVLSSRTSTATQYRLRIVWT